MKREASIFTGCSCIHHGRVVKEFCCLGVGWGGYVCPREQVGGNVLVAGGT